MARAEVEAVREALGAEGRHRDRLDELLDALADGCEVDGRRRRRARPSPHARAPVGAGASARRPGRRAGGAPSRSASCPDGLGADAEHGRRQRGAGCCFAGRALDGLTLTAVGPGCVHALGRHGGWPTADRSARPPGRPCDERGGRLAGEALLHGLRLDLEGRRGARRRRRVRRAREDRRSARRGAPSSPSSHPKSPGRVRGARPGGTRRARSLASYRSVRPRRMLPRRGRDVVVTWVNELRLCSMQTRWGMPLQRRRRARALQLHPPGGAPRRSDRRRYLHRRCVARAGPAAARRRRAHRPHRRPCRTRASSSATSVRGRRSTSPTYWPLGGTTSRPSSRGALDDRRPGFGAGPGDPGLITVRGLERLRTCDAVVYDRLVAPELVDEAPDDALRISRDGIAQETDQRAPCGARPPGTGRRPAEGRRSLPVGARRRGGARARRGGHPRTRWSRVSPRSPPCRPQRASP